MTVTATAVAPTTTAPTTTRAHDHSRPRTRWSRDHTDEEAAWSTLSAAWFAASPQDHEATCGAWVNTDEAQNYTITERTWNQLDQRISRPTIRKFLSG